MRVFLTMFVAAAATLPFAAHAADDKAAEKILRDNDCTKCHSVAKEKEGPPYRKVAEKYKGKPDGEPKIITHMTSEPVVEVDGKKEKHQRIKTDDAAALKNLAQWILSR